MSLFIEPKNIQMKLGKLGDDLDSSSNASTIQNDVKWFTEIISEFGNKTFTIKKRVKWRKHEKTLI